MQLEHENWYTAPHSCELQLVQKPAGTSEREKSLVRVTISQPLRTRRSRSALIQKRSSHYASNDQKQQAKGSDAEAGASDPTEAARDDLAPREPGAVAARGRLLVPKD